MSHTQSKKTQRPKRIKRVALHLHRDPKTTQKMFKKRSPFVQKVSTLLKAPILLSRLRKPIISRIISLKKSRKMKKILLLGNYDNGGYVKEYQFSPSSSPLIQQYYYRKPVKKKISADLYSMLFLGKCLGIARDRREEKRRYSYQLEVMVLPSNGNVLAREYSEASGFSEEDDSIDERAEKFIERFYHEMRLQRKNSFLSSNA